MTIKDSPAAGSPVAKVLVVDDHPPNLLAVAAILEPLGHRLVMASSGEEALRHLLRDDFALVLLDVQMAGMGGFETARLIKQPQRTRHIPIIFLTAVSRDTEHIFNGYRHGAVDYLLKPIEPENLRAKVAVFVDLYLQNEQIKRQAAMQVERTRLEEQERRALAEAEAAIRAREHALAVVSHDLRGPLASVSTGVTSMLDGLPRTAENEAHRRDATAMLRATEQMSRLLNDLLDVSRIEAGQLSLERSSHGSAELLGQALATFQPHADERRQLLSCEDGAANTLVLCDRARILQVFSNLIGNAIKLTPSHGTIRLRSRVEGSFVQFSVRDTGRGIPPEQLPHILERYWQARTADHEGIDLRIAITKGLVEAHGGRLSVDSSPTGTTFTFSIPIAGPGPRGV